MKDGVIAGMAQRRLATAMPAIGACAHGGS